MALTFGFYNSVEGDRKYDAIQFGRIFDGIITDGVYATYEKGMVVKASNNAGEVIIQPGRAWFNHTWNYNDADFVMEAPAPEVLLDRIDALVLDINEEQAVRANSFAWVKGTPSSNPVRPTLTNTTTHHQYPLCYVRRYAETTMIYTKDITSMVGTSECPFVTGVLEGMDIDAWINQWDNEFHTWEGATKVSFEAWMLTQQTDYTAWFNAVRDQLGTDMTEFEAWFESIKGIIDEEAATHLQAEIDEIKTMLPAGSHITITTTDTELFSRNVIIRDDFGHEITSKFNTSGVAVFETVPYVGSLTISSTDGIRTATNVVNTPYFARYEFPLAFWSATVNIEGVTEMAGYTVTVYNSEETVVSSIVLNAQAKGVFNATYPDEFIFRITYGGETMEVSLDVREETTYTVTLSAGFNWRTWCTLGGVSTSGYSSLSDVFNDEVAVRRLMTVHASADYLIEEVTKKLTTIDYFVANDTAMKWIGLRDYVCDGLTAISGVEAKFLASQYWERYLKDHVPVMTSNTAPYGTAFVYGGTEDSSNRAWHAFDNTDSTYARITANANPRGVGYKFTNPISVRAFRFYYVAPTGVTITVKLQYSDDGSTYNDATSKLSYQSSSNTLFKCDDVGYHLYWRILVTTSTSVAAICHSLQFYGRALDVSVPVMTSNTAPYGEVIKSGIYSSQYEAYLAFDGNNTTRWNGNNTLTHNYIGYHFGKPVCVKRVYIDVMSAVQSYGSSKAIAEYKIQGSNDGSTWVDIYTGNPTAAITGDHYIINEPINNIESYKSYRLYSLGNDDGSGGDFVSFYSLQFYGVDYSEREFASGSKMKYLYDHGLELEDLTIYTSSGTAEKRADDIYLKGNSSKTAEVRTTSSKNFSSYDVLRAKIFNCVTSVMLAAVSTPPINYGIGTNIIAVKQYTTPMSESPYNLALDVSSINQSAYPTVYAENNGSVELTELWLE